MQAFTLFFLLPFVLAVKELPGEELPSKDSPLQDDDLPFSSEPGDQGQMVKRSISEIAARRRSALDKTFMRFGRSDPDMPTEQRVKMSGANLMRFGRSKQSGFLRLGRARASDFMRFGRSPGNLMRFGRSNSNLMRFGRANNNLMRFGRGGNNLMRFGRGGNNLMRFGRANNNLMRFGRANNNLMRFGRANNNLMRFGRSDDDFANYDNELNFEELNDEDQTPTVPSDSFIRAERSVKDIPEQRTSNYADRKNDNFMRLGRSLLEKNYEDEDEPDNQEPFRSNDKEVSDKLKMYLDENFVRNGIENQDGDAFDILFPEDTRRKRSLVQKTEKEGIGGAVGVGADDPAVRHVKPDVGTKCTS